MRWSSVRHKGIGGVVTAVLVLQGVALVSAQPASAAAVQLPFTVTNNSGRSDATYIYVVARNSANQQGYVDAGGTWHAYPFPASIPAGTPNPAAPDVSIAGPATGASKTITLPPSLSGGRIYLSMGAKLQFFMTTSGLVEPAPWVASDPNANVLYDWTEFARASNGGDGIFINSTTVDMFSMPLSVSVTSSAGASDTEGITGNRTGIINAVTALGGDWAKLLTTRASDGLPLRVLAPIHGIQNGVFSTTYLDAYIAAAWTYYQTHTLSVDTAWGTMTGTVSGTTMTMKDPSGVVAGTLPRPTTADVFGCSGATQPAGQPNEPEALAFGARVCAAFHRATLSTASRVMFDHQPTTDPTQFYGQSASDLYSKVMHANSLNGKAYGFAYDDVGAFAPTIDQPDPASAGMTIGSFGTTGGSGGTGGTGGTVTGSTIVGPGGKCVDVAGDDTGVNNTAVQLWDCQATAVDQHWTLTAGTLRTLGRCLDITAGGTGNGTQLQLYDCNGSGAQQWVTQADGSIRNPTSGRCIDSPSGATANGTRLQIYDCNGTAAQKFSYNAGATVINGPGAKCVDVAGDDTGGNGTAVQLWDCQATAKDQQWTWSGGTLQTLGRCLDITGGGTANSTKLELWDCNGTAGQQWVQNADGTMRNPASARCMDATAGATANGTRLQIYDCNGTAAQVFTKA